MPLSCLSLIVIMNWKLSCIGMIQSFQENYNFSLSSYYSHGITTVVCDLGWRLDLVKQMSLKELSWDICMENSFTIFVHWQTTCNQDDIKRVIRYYELAFLQQRGKQIWMVFSGCIPPHGALLAAKHPGWLKCIQGPDRTSHVNKVSLGERKHFDFHVSTSSRKSGCKSCMD